MRRTSCDTDGMRAGKCSHAVEHASADCHFGRLGADLARPQRMAGERFEPIHQVLDQRATVVTAGLLPFAPATLCDGLDGGIAPCRTGRRVRPLTCSPRLVR